MRIPEISTAGQAPRSTLRRSSYKRTVTVVATFSLATAFALTGAPAATASTNKPIPFTSVVHHPGGGNESRNGTGGDEFECDPWNPGLCPPWQPGQQGKGQQGKGQQGKGQQGKGQQGKEHDVARSTSTRVTNADPASSPSHDGPLCPGVPGTCPN
jgi:hypothetical protein